MDLETFVKAISCGPWLTRGPSLNEIYWRECAAHLPPVDLKAIYDMTMYLKSQCDQMAAARAVIDDATGLIPDLINIVADYAMETFSMSFMPSKCPMCKRLFPAFFMIRGAHGPDVADLVQRCLEPFSCAHQEQREKRDMLYRNIPAMCPMIDIDVRLPENVSVGNKRSLEADASSSSADKRGKHGN